MKILLTFFVLFFSISVQTQETDSNLYELMEGSFSVYGYTTYQSKENNKDGTVYILYSNAEKIFVQCYFKYNGEQDGCYYVEKFKKISQSTLSDDLKKTSTEEVLSVDQVLSFDQQMIILEKNFGPLSDEQLYCIQDVYNNSSDDKLLKLNIFLYYISEGLNDNDAVAKTGLNMNQFEELTLDMLVCLEG